VVQLISDWTSNQFRINRDQVTLLRMKQVLFKAALCLLLPPLSLVLLCEAEVGYWQYGFAPIYLVLILFGFSGILCVLCWPTFCRFSPWFSIPFALIFATTPFWGLIINETPNVHGYSGIFWVLYILTAWFLSICLITMALWQRLFRRKNEIISILTKDD